MKYEYWFAKIKGVRADKKKFLHERMKTAEALYYSEEETLKKLGVLNDKERTSILKATKQTDLQEEYERMLEKKIQLITCFSEQYPRELMEIPDPPYALYVKGKLPDKEEKKIAIVGSRRCTPYGEKYAVDFGEKLAKSGIQVISGMARGIDGMGHRGALMAGGKTFAVLGCGSDVCYPKEHIGLYVDILERGGGIISEFPPGTPPYAYNFPARNRIISGMSECIIVIEAGKKSGSLITVDMALEQGRDVYALPGPINSEMSEGCNYLIKQGAGIILSPEMLLDEISVSYERFNEQCENVQKNHKNEKMLETPEELLYSCLGLYPMGVEDLMKKTKMDIKKVMEALISLELDGYIKEISKNMYVRCVV